MFRPDPSLDHVPATRDTVVSLIESINQPVVQAPGHAAQPARAWVVGTRLPSGGLSLQIYLQLLESGDPVVYRWEGGAIGVEDWPDAELEALSFVESLGFIVDNLGFRNLPPERKDEILAREPCFHPPEAAPQSVPDGPPAVSEAPAPPRATGRREAPTVPRPGPSLDPRRAARLGRLLGSF